MNTCHERVRLRRILFLSRISGARFAARIRLNLRLNDKSEPPLRCARNARWRRCHSKNIPKSDSARRCLKTHRWTQSRPMSRKNGRRRCSSPAGTPHIGSRLRTGRAVLPACPTRPCGAGPEPSRQQQSFETRALLRRGAPHGGRVSCGSA